MRTLAGVASTFLCRVSVLDPCSGPAIRAIPSDLEERNRTDGRAGARIKAKTLDLKSPVEIDTNLRGPRRKKS